MVRFPKLGANATVPDILKMSPDAGKALMELHEVIMRGPSPLTPGERELIAAYVSGLNRCQYCFGVHAEAAKAFGIGDNAISKMLNDPDTARLDHKMRVMLHLVRKLTQEPASITDDDAEEVYAAGWNEKALHDAIMVVCCFNFMNRLLEGHGVHGHEKMYKQRGAMLKNHGYLPLVRLFNQVERSVTK